jgi:hypothetical protein
MAHLTRWLGGGLALVATIFGTFPLRAEPVPVRHREGSLHGFLELRDAAGKMIADGDLIQSVIGSNLRTRLVFRFRDGSIDDERTVVSQNGSFHLLHDRHIQKGPSFPHPMDVEIDTRTQQVTNHLDKDGKPAEEKQHVELPDDLANGLPLTLAKNIARSTPETRVSYLATMPKARLVHLLITPDGATAVSVGRMHYTAYCYVFHVQLGGIVGVVAPLVGKQPPDDRVWVLEGQEPAFIRAQVSFYEGGPLWTIQLASPVWPHASK